MSWVIRSPSCSALRISRERPPSSGHCSIIWSSRRAAWTLFCPASMKRSKKVRSRGRSEKRATGRILVTRGAVRVASAGRRGELLGRPRRVALAQLLLDAAALAPRARRAASSRRRRRAPRRWRCRRSSAPARRASRPAGPGPRPARPARRGCRGCAASGRRSPSAPASPRRAGRRRCASARGSGRRSRRRGCSPRPPARPAAGSRCRAR